MDVIHWQNFGKWTLKEVENGKFKEWVELGDYEIEWWVGKFGVDSMGETMIK
jgi:hypothetical protein